MQQSPDIRLIQGPVGSIEIATFGVEADLCAQSRGLFILHPHPLHGGTMGNKIVTTLARIGRDAGMPTFALNFRGAGRSEGVFDHGRGEVDDALAVVHFGYAAGVREWILAGFSFGASVAGRLVPRIAEAGLGRVIDLVQVAPAVENFPVEVEPLAPVSTMVLFNEDDDVVSPEAMRAYVAELDPDEQHIAATGGHFYHGELLRLKQAVIEHWRTHGILPDARD